MSFFVAGILRIIILEASAALLVIARFFPKDDARGQRRLDLAFKILAVIALFSWTNYGSLRGGDGWVHRWEQYHFYFGSKYLPEVGYFNLYKATILVDREVANRVQYVARTRELTTFDEVSVAETLARDGAAVRAGFSDARWREFGRDWELFSRNPGDWNHILSDHGNSGSPAWAIFAAPIARLAGIGPGGQKLMGLCDFVLMFALFVMLALSFGTRPFCVFVVIFSMLPFCFDYLAGSLLRWDWLFALGMCLCFLKRERYLVAGAFLGYAIASKLFPVYFALALALHAGWTVVRTHKLDRRWLRLAAGAAVTIALAVTISSAMFGGLKVWRGYRQRIEVARVEKYYGLQYSFRTLFLQAAASRPREFLSDWMLPPTIKQGLPDVDIGQWRLTFGFWQLLLTAIVAAALRYTDAIEALAVGPLLVYVWLIVNAYYWNMLALTALAWTRAGRLLPLIGLHVVLMWFYVYQHLNHAHAGGYFVGFLLFWLLLLWAGTTVLWGRKR
jgi:hypothetical protein